MAGRFSSQAAKERKGEGENTMGMEKMVWRNLTIVGVEGRVLKDRSCGCAICGRG